MLVKRTFVTHRLTVVYSMNQSDVRNYVNNPWITGHGCPGNIVVLPHRKCEKETPEMFYGNAGYGKRTFFCPFSLTTSRNPCKMRADIRQD